MAAWMSRDRISSEDPRDYLRHVGKQADDAIELAEAALAFAALDNPQCSIGRYRDHLQAIAHDVAEEAGRLSAGADTLGARTMILNEVIFTRHGYRGDSHNYDDLQNANLMRVIDRRRGLPVALGIIYIHAGRAQDWDVTGINFPAHFMVRLSHLGQRAIIDPFNEGTVREVSELREMIKTSHGEDAALHPEHYAAVGNRDVLLRLQNNLKLRLCQSDDNARAVKVVENMMLIAPDEVGLWHDLGVLHGKTGNLRAAISALETFLGRAGQNAHRHHAATLLQELRTKLN
jgi:regulator of sirC expression with transglutaminase-like and TPR domain